VGDHEIKFRGHKEMYTFWEMPGVSPPMLLSQGVSFGHSVRLRFGEVKDRPKLLFKEEDLSDGGSSLDLVHVGNKKMFFFSPSVHMFEEPPFHFLEFFSVENPAISLQRLSKLDQGVFEVVPQPLHNVEVIVLERGLRPYFTNDFRESSPEVKDHAVGVDLPAIEFLEESFGHATAIEQGTDSL
jgi:hypothetical protein